MRNGTLHAALEAFTRDVAPALQAERVGGAEVPFELVEEPGGPTPLYCYRALTGDFISERLGLLTALPTYGAAVRALEGIEATGAYLRQRGVRVPEAARHRCELALEHFLAAVFADRSRFEFDRGRFETAFAELERALYQGRCVTTALAPLFGVGLDRGTSKIALGDGLALVRGDTFEEAPFEAVWSEGEASVLAVFTVVGDRRAPAPVELVRAQLRRAVTTLRLYEPGSYALGPTAWMKVDTGSWRPLALSFTGQPGPRSVIASDHEDELRGFFNLIARRADANGQLAWALARFEMGAERHTSFESLTDYLLAARVLLEPEGPGARLLADRMAAICASPSDRERVGKRIARAEALERLAMSGVPPAGHGSEEVVFELCEHVRALLRDMLCGHLDGDICALADQLLREARVSSRQATRASAPPVREPEGPTGELRLGSDQVGLGVNRQDDGLARCL